jgi:hypothetical protein
MATKVEVPLGKLEDLHLEFKSAAVLENPDKVAREVVAMLNADGGEVWIGLREEDGRAMEIEPIRDAESASSRLLDFLLDTLDPSPKADEVAVAVVPLPGGADLEEHLLRVRVKSAPSRKPYALVRGSAWFFPRRVGARLMPMSREEILETARRDSAREEDLSAARNRLLAWREQEQLEGVTGLWLGLITVPAVDFDIQSRIFEELATDPSASRNRRSGYSFVSSGYRTTFGSDRVRWGGFHPSAPPISSTFQRRVAVFEDGSARFSCGYGGLTSRLARGNEEINPHALLELPTSALRIMSRAYTELARLDFRLLAELDLFDLDGRTLWSHQHPNEARDIVFERPLEFTKQEILTEPDRCAFRLVRRVFQAFGLRESFMPADFDERSGRLVMSE